jgi:S1-C subfamily serine protease
VDAERLGGQEWRYTFEAPRAGQFRVFGGPDGGQMIFGGADAGADGLQLVPLNPSLGGYFGTERGVLVADVPDSSTLGLRPGDVVLRVGDREVTRPEDVHRALRSYRADEDIALRVRREGRDIDVTGRLGG